MELSVLTLIAAFIALAALSVLAVEEGADSRPGPRDTGHDWP